MQASESEWLEVSDDDDEDIDDGTEESSSDDSDETDDNDDDEDDGNLGVSYFTKLLNHNNMFVLVFLCMTNTYR